MNLIERVKNILITPKTEWAVIETETATPASILTAYVLPLSIVAAAGTFLRFFLFAGGLGFYGLQFIITSTLVTLVASALGFFLTTLIVDMLAPSFGSEKNMGRSAQLVAYSGTPSYIGSLLSFIPFIGWLISIAAWCYGVYLMYLGIGPIKKTPEDKKVLYMLVAFVIMIAIYFILIAIIGGIAFAVLGRGALAATGY